ncbi:MAG: shikimate dehydrogenase [Aquificaceae bacterium]
MTIRGDTLLYGVVGNPVKHSLSPVFQNRLFKLYGINAVYIPLEVDKSFASKFLKNSGYFGFQGLNITLPYKEIALKVAKYSDEHARKIGAANTLKFNSGELYAYNTDWIGVLNALDGFCRPKKALVLGAGGAAKAAIYALLNSGAEVFVWNRTKTKAKTLCAKMGCKAVSSVEEFIRSVDLILNATSASPDAELFDYSLLEKNVSVFDMSYRENRLLKSARESGCNVKDGLDMLIYQGLESFKIWTGIRAKYQEALDAILESGR